MSWGIDHHFNPRPVDFEDHPLRRQMDGLRLRAIEGGDAMDMSTYKAIIDGMTEISDQIDNIGDGLAETALDAYYLTTMRVISTFSPLRRE